MSDIEEVNARTKRNRRDVENDIDEPQAKRAKTSDEVNAGAKRNRSNAENDIDEPQAKRVKITIEEMIKMHVRNNMDAENILDVVGYFAESGYLERFVESLDDHSRSVLYDEITSLDSSMNQEIIERAMNAGKVADLLDCQYADSIFEGRQDEIFQAITRENKLDKLTSGRHDALHMFNRFSSSDDIISMYVKPNMSTENIQSVIGNVVESGCLERFVESLDDHSRSVLEANINNSNIQLEIVERAIDAENVAALLDCRYANSIFRGMEQRVIKAIIKENKLDELLLHGDRSGKEYFAKLMLEITSDIPEDIIVITDKLQNLDLLSSAKEALLERHRQPRNPRSRNPARPDDPIPQKHPLLQHIEYVFENETMRKDAAMHSLDERKNPEIPREVSRLVSEFTHGKDVGAHNFPLPPEDQQQLQQSARTLRASRASTQTSSSSAPRGGQPKPRNVRGDGDLGR